MEETTIGVPRDLNDSLKAASERIDRPVDALVDEAMLGFSDAAVNALADRRGGRVLTLDLRHFGVVAREGRIVLLPES